jgi:hypothetical protein
MPRALLLIGLGTLACTDVRSAFHCNGDNGACVLDNRQGRCEPMTGYCSFEDYGCAEGRRYGPHSGTLSGTCVGEEPLPGDGPPGPPDTQDPDQPPENDHPSSATEIFSSGEFEFDLRNATHDGPTNCIGDASDVFFQLSVGDPEVIYLDTLGSQAALEVRRTGCGDDFPGDATCHFGECGDQGGGQLAEVFFPGSYCLAISGEGFGTLRVVRGGRPGTLLHPDTEGSPYNTCEGQALAEPSCAKASPSAAEAAFFMAVCDSSTLVALSSPAATMFARQGSAFSSDLDCGAGSIEFLVDGPGLAWIFVEGAGECGLGTLSVSGRP